jgi:hypothetical protein
MYSTAMFQYRYTLFNKATYVGFEVLMAVSTKMAVFWVVAPCSVVEGNVADFKDTSSLRKKSWSFLLNYKPKAGSVPMHSKYEKKEF